MLLSNLALAQTALGGVHEWTHGGASVASLGLAFQEPVAVSHLNSTLLMWFVGIAAAAIVLQALILLGMAIGGMKIAKDLMKIVEDTRAKTMPLIESTQHLVKDLTPQIKTITRKVEVIAGHVENISGVAAEKVHEFSPTVSAARQTVEEANQTVRDANRKTHEQVMRVNDMITAALDSTARAGVAFQRGLGAPGRQLAGWTSGLKAGFEQLVGKTKSFGEERPLAGRRTPYEGTGSPYRAPANRYSSMSEEAVGRPVVPETREFGR